MQINREQLDLMCKKFADQGRLIEIGWIALRFTAISDDAPEVQLNEMRYAFFAGAQHLLGSMMQILEPGEDATANDLGRMNLIAAELDAFGQEIKNRGIQKI